MLRIITKGATSQSIYLEVLDSTSTTGARKTGLVFNSAGLTAYYVRNQSTATAITLATLANPNSAYSSGGFREVDATNMPGVYRLDVPDAAFASGVDGVIITLKGATGMVQVSASFQLVSINLQDAVRLGLTALPNAAAEAAGGLYTRGSGAGQINQPANGMVDANVVRNAGTAITASAGRQEVNTTHAAGTAWGSGAITAGAIASDAFTAAKFASASLNGKGDWNIGKTGYDLSAGGVQAIWDALTSALSTANSIGKLLVDNINATISSRSTYAGGDTSGTSTLLSRIIGTIATGTHEPQSGDAFARLGAPAGASVSVDVAAVKSDTAAVKIKTDALPTGIKKNTALNNFQFFMVNSTDHITGSTGLTVSGQISKDGGSFGALSNSVSEIGLGIYKVNLTATELNADIVTLSFTATGADGRLITLKTEV